jgi:proteasome lid subunit RPN8/RPN11
MTIWASRGRSALLRIPQRTWDTIIGELAHRGRGTRESGAFLLAAAGGEPRTVVRVVYFDDVDPNCLTGGIAIDGLAFSRLWDICETDDLRVVADIHTHPTRNVHQSSIDAANPMVSQAGHVAVIVPSFAQGRIEPHHAGVHLYDGTRWTTWTDRAAAQRLFVRRFL